MGTGLSLRSTFVFVSFVFCLSARGALSFNVDFEDPNDHIPTEPVSSIHISRPIPGEVGFAFIVDKPGDLIKFTDLSSNPGASTFGTRTLTAADTGTSLFNVYFGIRLVQHLTMDVGAFGTEDQPFKLTGYRTNFYTGLPEIIGVIDTLTGVVPGDPSGGFHTKTFTFDAAVDRIEFLGGAPGNQNVSYDNFHMSVLEIGEIPVPLPPAAYASIGAGAIAMIAHRRARRLKLL